MGRLLGNVCYLAGPMDRCPDNGVVWRRRVTPWLIDRGLIVFDPTDKPITIGDESREARTIWREAKGRGDYDGLSDHVDEIRSVDLRMVDLSHFLIAYVDMSIFSCGTMEEIFRANRQHKPVLVVCPQGKREAPDWLFGCLPHEHILGSLNDLCIYLDHVDRADHVETYGRWMFFDVKKLFTPRLLDCLRG